MSFCVFDVPKVVWSPVYDQGHDEESRNGRDVKINILDDYIRSLERFRVIRVFSGVPGSYGNTGEKQWASWALVGELEGRRGQPRTPSPSSPNWTRRGAAPPLSFLSLPPLPPFPKSNKEGGSPTPGGSRTPLGAALLGRPPPPPLLLYIQGQGGTSRHNNTS